MKQGLGVTHAKTILSGEHSVVYGHPAIAFPIKSLELKAIAKFVDGPNWLDTPFHRGEVDSLEDNADPLEKRLAETAFRNVKSYLGLEDSSISISITGMIPPARGLGSSAAVAGAVIRAAANLAQVELSDAELFELVQRVERVAHGTPSGLDAHATSQSEPIWFEAGKVKRLRVLRRPALLVADTGLPGHTVEAVMRVKELRSSNPKLVTNVFENIADLTRLAVEALKTGDHVKLGEVMNANQESLSTIGVSNDSLESLVQVARKSGALGAKLTGGGLGGCIVVLAEDSESLKKIGDDLIASGANETWFVNGLESV